MTSYILKRLALFIPTLLIIIVLAFLLSQAAPGDPVMIMNFGGVSGEPTSSKEIADQEKVYRETSALLGLDKPTFYFTLSPKAYPDTLYKINNPNKKQSLKKLIAQYGNWPQIDRYFKNIEALEKSLFEIPDSIRSNKLISARRACRQLYPAYKDERITNRIGFLETTLQSDSLLNQNNYPVFLVLKNSYSQVINQSDKKLLYLPDFKWYGWDNQFHTWFKRFIVGDFGVSYRDGRPVGQKIWNGMRWTLLINGIAIFLAYLISIPLGVYVAARKGSRIDRFVSSFLFMLYSVPSFWVATLLIVFFSTPEYGMDWFPTFGLGDLSKEIPFWTRFWDVTYHLILPIFCLTYGALAFITRQMRGGMINALNKPFILTARAKGLSQRKVLWQHAFPNALFPIITLFASVFPNILAGSFVIEFIFSIPGMGELTINSIHAQDWPVVFAILILSAVLTIIGILIADILYALVDPRVKYK